MSGNGLGIGRSEHSVLKQKHFAGVVGYLSKVAKRAMNNTSHTYAARQRVSPYYWIFDMNSARPFYPLRDGDDYGLHLPSSSIIGPRVAARNGHQVRAVLMEIDEDNAQELAGYYFNNRVIHSMKTGQSFLDAEMYIYDSVLCGDSSELLLKYAQGTDASRFGYVYVDPNGPSIPKTLTEFYAHVCNQKIDLIINIAATSLKRQGLRLDQEMRQVMACKSKWLVREPYRPHQWTMLVGTNWVKIKDWSAKGFHLLDSEAGRSVFQRVSKTREELESEAEGRIDSERGQLEIRDFLQSPTEPTPNI